MVDPTYLEESKHPLASHCLRPSANRLVVAHRYLCARGARKFLRPGLERNDLEQVAALGLIKASRRFDASSGTPFEAFAWLMIVGELMHHVRDHEHALRIPRRIRSLERPYARACETLGTRLGREPRDAEIARELGVLVPTVAEIRRARTCAATLALEDADAARTPDRRDLALEDRLLMEGAFVSLDALQRRVICGVYVLGLTQVELARALGLSAKRVSRLHRAALSRMQLAWAS